jgi:hypothetical protein
MAVPAENTEKQIHESGTFTKTELLLQDLERMEDPSARLKAILDELSSTGKTEIDPDLMQALIKDGQMVLAELEKKRGQAAALEGYRRGIQEEVIRAFA